MRFLRGLKSLRGGAGAFGRSLAGWLGRLGMRPGAFAALSLLSGALLSICLPLPDLVHRQGNVRIEALGTRGPQAKSTEVWIVKLTSAGKAQPLHGWLGLPRGWETRGSMAVSYRYQPAVLDWSGQVEAGSELVLLKHDHSGRVRITAGGTSTEYDLYSPEHSLTTIDLTPASLKAERRVHWSSVVDVLIVAALLAIGAGLLIAATLRAGAVLRAAFADPQQACGAFAPDTVRWTLYFAAPSVVTFAASLLAFWPGQMSPDSIGQWQEATVGPLSDAFSLPHSSFIWLMARIWPSPALAIGVQSLLLALAIGFTLQEWRHWRVPTFVLAGASVAMALWPANVMMASVLWKDVLFAAGATAALGATMILVRTGGAALRSGAFCSLLVVALLLVSLMRLNMLPATLVFAPALVWLYPAERWRHRLRVAIPILLVPWLIKLVVIPVAGVQTLGPHYNAINAVHVIGAYAKADAIGAAADRALMERIMPLDKWSAAYDCRTVTPLFFTPYVDRVRLGEEYAAINRLALRLMAERPSVFLTHHACATTLLWRITHEPGLMLGVTPLEIFDMPEARKMGLVMSSKLPGLAHALHVVQVDTVLSRWCAIIWRPALPLFFLTILVLALMVSLRRLDVGLLALTAWLNTASLAVLIGAPDYRYQFAVVLAAMLTVPLLFVRPSGGATAGA